MARGYLYEISTNRDNLGNMDESDFYAQMNIPLSAFSAAVD